MSELHPRAADVAADTPPQVLTRQDLVGDLRALGIGAGDTVMVHAAVSRVGRLINGPDTVVEALLDAVGPAGTVVAYTDWEAGYLDLLDDHGRVPARWRAHVTPFDPASGRAARGYGVLPEFIRTSPGARRSGNPGASVAAIGADADLLTADHPLDHGYGPGSPLARLTAADAQVLMLGAPHDTMTLLHHAEHLADVPDKRTIAYEVPFATEGGTRWRMLTEFDTSRPVSPVLDELDEEPFAAIVADFLASGRGRTGIVGHAPSTVVSAAAMVPFAVRWLQDHCREDDGAPGRQRRTA